MKTKKNKKTRIDKKIDKIEIIPLGGLESIGKNMTLIKYKEEIIIIDCGIMFPTTEMPGIDFIIPDFSYLLENKKKIKALIATHGHEDHIGAIPFLFEQINVPLYATKFTLALIKSKFEEKPPRGKPIYKEVHPRKKIKIGPFSIEFIRVNHSIPDGVALAIETDLGTIIHSGDFKIDFSPVDKEVTDLKRFADYGESGVLLFLSDSTNAEKEGFTKSEAILEKKLFDIFSNAKSRIIVATFSSNINRIQQIFDTAQKFNRKVAISGMSMQKNIRIAKSLSYLNFKDDLIVDINKIEAYPKKKLVILGTGTQGEPLSVLTRISKGTHKHVSLEVKDSIVITASVIPGNEKMVINIVNSLMKMGADVFYAKEKDIHVSGHGAAKELKLMLSIIKPKFFMPVHGEFKHLKAHAEIAEKIQEKPSKTIIANNGDILELTKDNFKKKDYVNLSQIYVEGQELGDINNKVINERRTILNEGIMFVTIVVSEGLLLREPHLVTKGFIEDKKMKALPLISKEVLSQAEKMLKDNLTSQEIETHLKKRLSSFIYKNIQKRPLISVQILEV